jgi:hypothetical protein
MACYIAPSDSTFHSFAPLAEMSERIKKRPHENFILIGDLNARFGEARTSFLQGKELPPGTHYKPSPDPINAPNSNAKYILNAASPLLLLNNLSTPTKDFKSALTFRQGENWISEVDGCLITPSLLKAITEFKVDQRTSLPSDHAPIGIAIQTGPESSPSAADLKRRSKILGNHEELEASPNTPFSKRGIRMDHLDPRLLKDELRAAQPPRTSDDVTQTISDIDHTLYMCAVRAKTHTNTDQDIELNSTNTIDWNTLLVTHDSKALWKKINWNGTISSAATKERPSDSTFKDHFEVLLNPPNAQPVAKPTAENLPYLPVTDDPISPSEVIQALKMLKSNKSGGPSGVPPGLLKHLPDNWIALLTRLFSCILQNGTYPNRWSFTKLVILFKKGSPSVCDNYRGISLVDSLAKVYDIILNRRLSLWFKPDSEQAGAQKGRSCTEHLTTLRLIIDFAQHKRKKLYIVFVDFSKAYDRVPRAFLIRKMQELGCGFVMTNAITAAYENTTMLLQKTAIKSSMGVRQGSPTSCLLFTMVVNGLIRALKQKCHPDDFLGTTHSLMMMDDTVLLSTSRERAEEKILILREFCEESGMILNATKTKFMVIRGSNEDNVHLSVADWKISNCSRYNYLGAIFTQDGRIASSIQAQCNAKMAHAIKYEAFVKKNSDAPFPVKLKVFESALVSAVLYGSEAWMSPSASSIANPLYSSCVRSLLGVRKTTATNLCLIEAGIPCLPSRLKSLQKKFFDKARQERAELADDPLMFALDLARRGRTPCSRYIDSLQDFNQADEDAAFLQKARLSERSKFRTYLALNPDLEKHPMYSCPEVDEFKRIATTKLRLSAHNLAVERGRWQRQPREERVCRLCNSGEVQDEAHIISSCTATQRVRTENPSVDFSIPEVFAENPVTLTSLVYTIMKPFI